MSYDKKSFDINLAHQEIDRLSAEVKWLTADNNDCRSERASYGDTMSGIVIDREAEIIRLRTALDDILAFPDCTHGPAWRMQTIARAGLEEPK